MNDDRDTISANRWAAAHAAEQGPDPADRASLHKHSERAATLDRGRDAMPQHTHEASTTQIGPYTMGCRACDQNRAYIQRVKIEGIRREIETGQLDSHLSQLETSIQFRRAQLHCADL